MQSKQPYLIEGGLFIDDRGSISFCNGFQFEGEKVLPRGESSCRVHSCVARSQVWGKYVAAVSGAALVCAVEMDSKTGIQRFVLSSIKPSVLFIPPGYANGWMSLTGDTRLMFFSTATLEESQTDDIRFPAYRWNPWPVKEQ